MNFLQGIENALGVGSTTSNKGVAAVGLGSMLSSATQPNGFRNVLPSSLPHLSYMQSPQDTQVSTTPLMGMAPTNSFSDAIAKAMQPIPKSNYQFMQTVQARPPVPVLGTTGSAQVSTDSHAPSYIQGVKDGHAFALSKMQNQPVNLQGSSFNLQ